MENIINKIKERKFDLRDCDLIDIVHFKIFDNIISLEELEKIKNLIDSTIDNVREQTTKEENRNNKKYYEITSEYVAIENDKIVVDYKGLKNFYIWELNESIVNGANDNESLSYLYKIVADVEKDYITIEDIINDLKGMDYNIKILESKGE